MRFLPSSGPINTAIWMHFLDVNKTAGEKAWQQLHNNAASNIEQVLEATTPQNTNYMATYHPSRKLSKLDKPEMQDTAGEAWTSS